MLRWLLTFTLAGLLLGACGGRGEPGEQGTSAPRTAIAVAVPAGLPTTLQLGMASAAGDAQRIAAIAPFGYRYAYLAGGAGTRHNWQTWGAGDGSIVGDYIRESRAAAMVPVFSYYNLYQSLPAGAESEALAKATARPDIMAAYFHDLARFFELAAAEGGTVVLHVEPDLWGFFQARARAGGASTVPVVVASPVLASMDWLPQDARGFARAIVALRDRLAPNVLLGYHISPWAAGDDPFVQDVSVRRTREIGAALADFYDSLGAPFDLVFYEFSDRDAGYKQIVLKDGGANWWDERDFERHLVLLGAFNERVRLPLIAWQIPYGNTKMRALNNTDGHYQDNRVESLLEEATRHRLEAYAALGTIAFLFGRGADGPTDASDAKGDGVTNPEPINGNLRESLSADDDGGYFAERARAYYAAGVLPLPGVPPR